MKIKKIFNKPSYVTIVVLILMMVLMTITYFFASALFSETAIARNNKGAQVAFSLAEGGIQEAIYKVQYDTATRDTFLNTTNGTTTFSHSSALVPNGSYQVTIQNTDKAAAKITATGFYQMGLKQAQRVSTLNILQTTTPGAYTLDAVLFVGGPDSGDISFTNANVTHDDGYDPSSMIGGRDISFKNANVNMTQDIRANRDITRQNSNIVVGGVIQANDPTTYSMPNIDVTSDCSVNANSYKCLAQTQGTYYGSSQSYVNKSNLIFNGITYVAGDITFTNVSGLIINGALVAEGSISFTNVSNLVVNHSSGPSGLITLKNLNTTNMTGSINGLVYVGVQSSVAVNTNLTITGAIFAHQFTATNANLKFNFKPDWVNDAIQPNNSQSPVIQLQHWEEEY